MTKLLKLTILLFIASLVYGIAHANSEIVLQTVAMESASESLDGQYAVASVIVNRSIKNHPFSYDNLIKVCLKPKQFSCWNDKEWAYQWLATNYTDKVRSKAKMALEMAIKQPIEGITHYHTKDVHPYWAKGKKPKLVIGSHLFYEGIK